MNKLIAVDLDETLADTVREGIKFHDGKINGIDAQFEDISDYHFENIQKFGITQEQAIYWFNSFLESDAAQDIKPIPGAKQKLIELKNKGYKLVILTARIDDHRTQTEQRITTHFPDLFEAIIFANYYSDKAKTKATICQKIGANIMIEDNIPFAQDIVHAGIQVYILDKPWNQNHHTDTHPGMIKIASRDDLPL